jgi:uracil-DNA glycosylase family 4
MTSGQPSPAWEMLTGRQQQEMEWLVARMNMGRMRSATPPPSSSHDSTVRKQDFPAPGRPVGTGSMETPSTAAPCSAGTTSTSAPSTVLVVDPMPRPDRLDRLYLKVKQDPEFAHLAGGNFVPGDGKWPGPAAMLIGEAPGVHEDRLGRPFVGKSGNFLDNCLWDGGLKRADCFITNVVKWRPPANRTPTMMEIEAAIPHLRKEVVTVLPEGGLVILLGAVPLNVVDQGRRISKCHGEPFSSGSWTFVPMYHPAFIMRGMDTRRDAYRAEWQKIKELHAA